MRLTVVCVMLSAVMTAQSTHRNLGANVNSAYQELQPYMTVDGSKLFFTRENHPENTLSPQNTQDIWYCKKNEKGEWETAKHLGYPFNQTQFGTIFYQSPDGTKRIIRGAYKKGLYQGNGYSECTLTAKGWSDPEALDISRYDKMSKGQHAGICFSPDNEHMIMYFSETENGPLHLYVSFHDKGRKWSKPISLGTTINLPGTESSTPFMAADGVTLYFSSDRAGGQGGADIWMSRRLDESWTNWSTPVNLGPGVNTPQWDAYYTMSASGDAFMVTTDPNGFGASDIVQVQLIEETKPNPVVLIRGRVLNFNTAQPLEAGISYQYLPGGNEAGSATSAPGTGEYQIVLPYGKLYAFSAGANGYYAVSENLDLTTISTYTEINKDLFLVPIETGQTVRLNNIFFETGSAALKPESFPELNKLVKMLNENPKIRIVIEGHTDNVGTSEANQILSENRAKAVHDFLLAQGIAADRLSYSGFGENKPVGDNSTQDGRALNRRVMFRIVEK